MKSGHTSQSEFAETLKRYKSLSERPENHVHLLRDKTAILFTASLLESSDASIISSCMDIIDDFVNNDATHATLISTFGIFEALESTAIRLRGIDSKLANRAADMTDILRKDAPPAYSTRLRLKGRQLRKRTAMYQLYIPSLTRENRVEVDEALVRIKGIISFVVDEENQKCTIRITPKIDVAVVVKILLEQTGMKALLVTKNRGDVTEMYIDVLTNMNKKQCYPEYFPEDDTPVRGKSLANLMNLRKGAEGWVKSAADFLNKSFYW